ncbi:4-hydroxybenzoate octaprenyltransferase [bacterium]|nr:4-hydroxybenzoate octaprenyltransferase [bacterium]
MLLKRYSFLAFELVTFSHTLFVLPLILSGYLISFREFILLDFLLILIAAISARTIGMLLNRIIDSKIDSENPRTSSRPIPSKRATMKFVYSFLIGSLFFYFISCFFICEFIFMLSPIPIIFFTVYPYTKRFTPFCHFFLGASLALGPLAGSIASTCNIEGLYIVAPIVAFTLLWIAGFDILYALQDFKHDLKYKIFSIPAIYGIKTAVKVSSVCFILSIICLIYHSIVFNYNFLSFLIIVIISINFFLQITNTLKNNYSFFKYNSYIGFMILILVISDILFV